MPIASYDEEPIKEVVSKDIVLEINSTTIDNDEVVLENVLKYVDYPIWNVDYYRQLLGETDPSLPHDGAIHDTLQQYEKIKGLQIRVIDDLSDVTFEDNITTIMTGSGLVITAQSPNEGDMFFATLPNGRNGVFTITEVNKKSYNLKVFYGINYSFVHFGDTTSGRNSLKDLETKVIKNLTYQECHECNGDVVILEDSALGDIKELQLFLSGSRSWYGKFFIEPNSNAYIIPNDNGQMLYDPFITNFITNTNKHPNAFDLLTVNTINVHQEDVALQQDTFWDMLLRRDYNLLSYVNHEMGVVSSQSFATTNYVDSIKYNWIDYVVYPRYHHNHKPHVKNAKIVTDDLMISQLSSPIRLFSSEVFDNSGNLIPNVTDDDFYVLSKGFYTETTMTVFESMVMKYIKREELDFDQVLKVVKNYRRYGLVEQFYYLPIFWVLAKDVLRKKGRV